MTDEVRTPTALRVYVLPVLTVVSVVLPIVFAWLPEVLEVTVWGLLLLGCLANVALAARAAARSPDRRSPFVAAAALSLVAALGASVWFGLLLLVATAEI